MRSVQPVIAATSGEAPRCRLDAALAKSPTSTVAGEHVARQLHDVRARLDAGAGAAIGDRDRRNVWVQSALGTLLAQPPTPEE